MPRWAKIVFLLAVMLVVTAASASAAMVLPGFLNTERATASGGKGRLTVEGGASISCQKGSGSGTFNAGSTNLGQFTLDLFECTEGGEPCVSLGDIGLTILVSGELHLVLLEGTPMKWFGLLLPKETHTECPKAAVKLLLISGALLGLLRQKAGEKQKRSKSK